MNVLALALALAGCGRPHAVEERPRALPVDVYADTGRTVPLAVEPPAAARQVPEAAVWLARVSPDRSPPGLSVADVAPDTLVLPPPRPPALAVDDDLKPPLPRERGTLVVPSGARGSVELDVRVDERGEVSEVRWAGGSRDSLVVGAAVACARGMRFFPAQRAGQPVAVWCRQRFDLGVAEP